MHHNISQPPLAFSDSLKCSDKACKGRLVKLEGLRFNLPLSLSHPASEGVETSVLNPQNDEIQIEQL